MMAHPLTSIAQYLKINRDISNNQRNLLDAAIDAACSINYKVMEDET
jgi:hypothetical protein